MPKWDCQMSIFLSHRASVFPINMCALYTQTMSHDWQILLTHFLFSLLFIMNVDTQTPNFQLGKHIKCYLCEFFYVRKSENTLIYSRLWGTHHIPHLWPQRLVMSRHLFQDGTVRVNFRTLWSLLEAGVPSLSELQLAGWKCRYVHRCLVTIRKNLLDKKPTQRKAEPTDDETQTLLMT